MVGNAATRGPQGEGPVPGWCQPTGVKQDGRTQAAVLSYRMRLGCARQRPESRHDPTPAYPQHPLSIAAQPP